MNEKIQAAAGTYLAPKVLRAIRFRWLVFGAVAYFGLRYLNKRGIFPKQTGQAVDLIDRGVELAKEKIGFKKSVAAIEAPAAELH